MPTTDYKLYASARPKKIIKLLVLHKLLAHLKHSLFELTDTDTFAQQHKFEKQKEYILRFLGILGNHSKFEKEENIHLVVEGEAYQPNRGKKKNLSSSNVFG